MITKGTRSSSLPAANRLQLLNLFLILLLPIISAQLPVWHSPNYQCKDALAPWPVCKDPRALVRVSAESLPGVGLGWAVGLRFRHNDAG